MNPYYRHFLLLRQLFFAIALEIFERRGVSRILRNSSIDGGSFFGKQHPMAKNNSDEPRTLEIR
jgi:hypothetical protein